MGGFIYFDGEVESVLDFNNFRNLLGIDIGGSWVTPESPRISFPMITAMEIHDKARGDFLSKAIVILQSIWFILQCVAHGQQGFALTELELVTLALASLNGVMYFFWWDKPLGVKEPIKLYRRGKEPAENIILGERSEHDVRISVLSNFLNIYWMSRDERTASGLLPSAVLARHSCAPFSAYNPHYSWIPKQCSLPVVLTCPPSTISCPPSPYLPSTNSSKHNAKSCSSLAARTSGSFTFLSIGFSGPHTSPSPKHSSPLPRRYTAIAMQLMSLYSMLLVCARRSEPMTSSFLSCHPLPSFSGPCIA